MASATYLEDRDFQNTLLAFICRDERFLRSFGHLCTADDFKPSASGGEASDRWLVAVKAIEHWEKYQEPIGAVLGAEVREHIERARLGDRRKKYLIDFVRELKRVDLVNPSGISDKLLQYKREVVMSDAIRTLIDEQGAGQLSTDRFMEVARHAVSIDERMAQASIDFFGDTEQRILRREHRKRLRYPALMIEPFDMMVRAIAPGQLGCIIAPFKRGKSMALLHIARAYVIQHIKVLYITLEDPPEEVEDRLDAGISYVPIRDLNERSDRLRYRMEQFLRFGVKGSLKIIDGTADSMSVHGVEQAWMREREKGFTADAVIVDYAGEILPTRKQRERRFEFAEIFRDLRRFASRNRLLVWTAAQSKRNTSQIKNLSGDEIAEDISIVQKVACMIGIGRGDWGSDSIYLHVAAHKFDRQGVGVSLMTNKERMQIYDPELTKEAILNDRRDKARKKVEEREERDNPKRKR